MVSSVANARTRLLAGSRGRLLNGTLFALIAIALIILATKVAALGPAYFIQIVVYGLANGSIFALIALGYTMVYGIVELINFAHGDVFTLGGFISLWLLPIFGITEGGSAWHAIGVAPIFFWELSLGLWMTFKGFRKDAPLMVEAAAEAAASPHESATFTRSSIGVASKAGAA